MFPAHELFARLGELGLLGLEYDPAYGGQGADHLFSVILCEELAGSGCGGVPMAIGVQTMMATPSLATFGSEELKQRYLAPAIRGRDGRRHRGDGTRRRLGRRRDPHPCRTRW